MSRRPIERRQSYPPDPEKSEGNTSRSTDRHVNSRHGRGGSRGLHDDSYLSRRIDRDNSARMGRSSSYHSNNRGRSQDLRQRLIRYVDDNMDIDSEGGRGEGLSQESKNTVYAWKDEDRINRFEEKVWKRKGTSNGNRFAKGRLQVSPHHKHNYSHNSNYNSNYNKSNSRGSGVNGQWKHDLFQDDDNEHMELHERLDVMTMDDQ